jgi:hypothetical protein
MPRTGFYNDNANRSYPFLSGLELAMSPSNMPESAAVDFGCILGLDSGFVDGTHSIYLNKIQRVDDIFTFEFLSDAPGLADYALRFRRKFDEDEYAVEFVDAVYVGPEDLCDCGYTVWGRQVPWSEWAPTTVTAACGHGMGLPLPPQDVLDLEGCKENCRVVHPDEDGAIDVSAQVLTCLTAHGGNLQYYDTALIALCCDSDDCGERTDPVWEGYLITGDLGPLAAILSNGSTLTATAGVLQIEPSRIQNIEDTFARTISLANEARYHADELGSCSSYSPFDDLIEPTDGVDTLGNIVINKQCMVGPLNIKEGYNCSIRQLDSTNTITISAVLGSGIGDPCNDEVPRYENEPKPVGSTLYTGGPSCYELITSINGVVGSMIQIVAGTGITITSSPTEPNKVIVDVNFRDLTICQPPTEFIYPLFIDDEEVPIPSITTNTIYPLFIDDEAVFTPFIGIGMQFLYPVFIPESGEEIVPHPSFGLYIQPELLETEIVFTPKLKLVAFKIYPGFIEDEQVYSPSVQRSIHPAFIEDEEVFEPELRPVLVITPDFVDDETVYAPTLQYAQQIQLGAVIEDELVYEPVLDQQDAGGTLQRIELNAVDTFINDEVVYIPIVGENAIQLDALIDDEEVYAPTFSQQLFIYPPFDDDEVVYEPVLDHVPPALQSIELDDPDAFIEDEVVYDPTINALPSCCDWQLQSPTPMTKHEAVSSHPDADTGDTTYLYSLVSGDDCCLSVDDTPLDFISAESSAYVRVRIRKVGGTLPANVYIQLCSSDGNLSELVELPVDHRWGHYSSTVPVDVLDGVLNTKSGWDDVCIHITTNLLPTGYELQLSALDVVVFYKPGGIGTYVGARLKPDGIICETCPVVPPPVQPGVPPRGMHYFRQQRARSLMLRKCTATTIQLGPFVDVSDMVTEIATLNLAVEVSKDGGNTFAARHSTTPIVYDQEGWYRVHLDETDTSDVGSLIIRPLDAADGDAAPVWREFMVVEEDYYTARILNGICT